MIPFPPIAALPAASIAALPAALLAAMTLTGGAAPGDDARESAAFSRNAILPLVGKPGKDRRIFSKFETGKRVTWNKDFWGAPLGFDAFTGLGWHQPQVGILVTPEHVVGAAHYGVNHKGVNFYDLSGRHLGNRKPARDKNGKNIARKLTQDVLVIRLEAPAPEGAAIVRLPSPEGFEHRVAWGKLPASERPLLLATDWRNPRPVPPVKEGEQAKKKKPWRITRTAQPVLLQNVGEGNPVLQWTYGTRGDPGVHASYHEVVNKGDSSNPIFWVTKSGLVLASHFSGLTAGPDYGNPELQKKIQEAITETGGAKPYRLQFAPVP